VARDGDDLTIVSAGKGVADVLAAARTGCGRISAEVLDLRTLRPLEVAPFWSRGADERLLPSRRVPAPAGGPSCCSALWPSRACTISTTS